MSLILSLMWSMDCLVVKVLRKIISLICFRVYLEVIVFKNPTCFSRWSVRPTRLSKLSRNETVSMNMLGRICEYLECDVGDIVEYICEGKVKKRHD